MRTLFHGSEKRGLEKITPSESGHGKKCVYATSKRAFAAIFINTWGGSLVAEWGLRKDGTPYYCELEEEILNRNYSGTKGSIYTVPAEYFHQEKDFWSEEWISEEEVPVIEEERTEDVKEYLKELEREGELKIISYERRKEHASYNQKISSWKKLSNLPKSTVKSPQEKW